MKKLVFSVVAAACFGLPVEAKWQYVPADDPGNTHGGVKYVTDGNWAIKVDEWNPSNLKTSKGSGYLAGEGVLDLSEVNTDLGKSWIFEGGWVSGKYSGPFAGFTTITEVILPNETTSICYGMFRGCSNMTKLTVPSGKITSIGAGAFQDCSKLCETVPELVLSSFCSSYAEACLNGCTALKMPFKWTVDGNITCGGNVFVNMKIPEFDLSGVSGSISLTGYNNTATNIVWGPNARTFAAAAFSSAATVYFPGIVPVDTTYSPQNQRSVRFFGDPQMDVAWQADKVMGMTLNRPTEADFSTYATKYGVTAEEAEKTVLGWYPADTWTGNRIWIVKYKSPLNVGGLPVAVSVMRAESGTVTRSPDKESGYEEGESVTVTAVPAAGYAFSCWRGQLPESIDPYSSTVTFDVLAKYEMTAVITNCNGWTHHAATESEPELVTDGNWSFKVTEWKENGTTFKTGRGTEGYLGGSGVLDLRNVNTQLGRTWTFEGGWNAAYNGTFCANVNITEVILPKETTSICYGMFRGDTMLTKVTVPSGYLTSIGAGAFSGCSRLETFEPVSAASGVCSSYSESCFNGCSDLHIPLKWTVDGNITFGSSAFVNTGITEFDVSGVTGSLVSWSGWNNFSVTNTAWAPHMTTFLKFTKEQTIYFTGIVPTTTLDNRECRVYCDPSMDAGWRASTVAGVAFSKPTDEQRAAFAEKYGAAEASRIIGISSAKLYLIKWTSPFRKDGMKLLFR